MFDKAFELHIRSARGDELSEAEKSYLHERNAKYALVRYVFLDKMKRDGYDLVDFHFSPSEEFMDHSVYDIVSKLIKFGKKLGRSLDSGNAGPFGEPPIWDNPPQSGKKKSSF